ncbi:MAG TPA: discoidin domain-containing protein [Hanamia sp.]|nr:discoidin domain-containing protein [Hanamia sp.]
MKVKHLVFICLVFISIKAFCQTKETHFINTFRVSEKEFGNDRNWYKMNIPFFECSDTTLENVYYYRWKLYKAHLLNLGKYGYIVTEFLNAMSWDRKPYNSLNDATSYHIYEGRWLRNRCYMNDYINYMYKDGGNDRHFSEAIADAAYSYYLVNPDSTFITSQLPHMISIYKDWYDHYDSSKELYYIEPLLDATEYTIASIDASGGKDGFEGGDAFRPTINSYMYANAIAISKIALLRKDTATSNTYRKKALEIKDKMQKDLWNDSLRDFLDRYKVSNQYVKYWHFTRGRELEGYEPWAFNLPGENQKFNSAWKHLMDTAEFMGRYGLRTVEPSYQYYMKQYRYDRATGLRECQWNGPSWPFQTCMVLRGMANLLNNYKQHFITVDDYLYVLQQYAQQHYLNGKPDLVEDYDPDKGGAIVNIPQRSEHYNHSEFNDLIITGLCGLHPKAGNQLEINPLVTTNRNAPIDIKYFCLENVLYHGHNLTILYDKDGKKYHQGAGSSVYIDGERVVGPVAPGKKIIRIPKAIVKQEVNLPIDLAVNLTGTGFPMASSSYTNAEDKLNMAIDGRVWYFKNVRNRWSCYGSNHLKDWFQVTFEKPKNIDSIGLFIYSDGKKYASPQSYEIQYWNGNEWINPKSIKKLPFKPLGNTKNTASFNTIRTNRIRVNFTNAGHGKYTALSEMEIY